MKPEVILVGNGTSILDAANGSKIDLFPCVVRFNNCKLRGLESFTGTRTDVWFTVMKCCHRKIEELSTKEVFFHSWHKDENCPYFVSYAGVPNVTKVDHVTIPEICTFMDDDSYKFWSTGVLAIWLMLKRHPCVTLTGFDWWERENHHYADNEARGTLHKPMQEKKFIDKLVRGGKVQFL